MAEEARKKKEIELELFGSTRIPTRHGDVELMVFHANGEQQEHLAIIVGDLDKAKPVPVRLHSECFTSEVLGSLKCDCREQLKASLEYISNAGSGLIIYLRQEGRGIGLGNKIKAYRLQEEGMDTMEANLHLGFGDDLRHYHIAAAILKFLEIGRVSLLTNNPDKIDELRGDGIEVTDRIPLETVPNKYNIEYLKTKRDKAGHILEHLEKFTGGDSGQ